MLLVYYTKNKKPCWHKDYGKTGFFKLVLLTQQRKLWYIVETLSHQCNMYPDVEEVLFYQSELHSLAQGPSHSRSFSYKVYMVVLACLPLTGIAEKLIDTLAYMILFD